MRVPLDASRSEDPDSTPGTRDNIRHYRWYEDGSGRLVATGEVAIAEVRHRGEGTVTYTFTLEVVDAYGAKSFASTAVNLVPRSRQ